MSVERSVSPATPGDQGRALAHEPRSVRPGGRGISGHRRGPAFLLLGAMVGAMVAGRFETALFCVGVAAATAAAVGASWPSRAWLGTMAVGIGLAVGLNLYLNPGTPLPGPRILGLAPSEEGMRLGSLLALRLVGAAGALHGLRAAWPGETAADELSRLLRPLERLRVPVREARFVLGLALRFVPLLVREARGIWAVQELRAGRPPRGLSERLHRLRATATPALVSALERAERTALALDARHYRVRPIPSGAGGVAGWAASSIALVAAALLWRSR